MTGALASYRLDLSSGNAARWKEEMKFFSVAAVMVVLVTTMGITSQTVNDRTMENCTVDFKSNPFNNAGKSSVYTSCGYVYVASHMKNGMSLDKITKMNEALNSGKPVDIKATGFVFASAYEITVSK